MGPDTLRQRTFSTYPSVPPMHRNLIQQNAEIYDVGDLRGRSPGTRRRTVGTTYFIPRYSPAPHSIQLADTIRLTSLLATH
jgi:hypothetical protein